MEKKEEEFTIRKYQDSDFELWNSFIDNAKNATFLFHRNFMEYHKDRFEDFSLLIFNKAKLIAVLPANKVGEVVYSHQGLTYGGLIYGELKLNRFLNLFKFLLEYLNSFGIKKIIIKEIPNIFHLKPTEEIKYIFFLLDARLIRRDALSVINLKKNILYSKGRVEGIKRGEKIKLKIIEEPKFELFFNKILIPNLLKKHNLLPVHTNKEINYLHEKFPENIRQFNVYFENEIVAGVTVFETKEVVHIQYISANETKNKLGSLDYLFHFLITKVFNQKKFLNFGNSNENNGKNINQGLLFWKESFGASTIVQDFQEIDTSNYHLLEDVLI